MAIQFLRAVPWSKCPPQARAVPVAIPTGIPMEILMAIPMGSPQVQAPLLSRSCCNSYKNSNENPLAVHMDSPLVQACPPHSSSCGNFCWNSYGNSYGSSYGLFLPLSNCHPPSSSCGNSYGHYYCSFQFLCVSPLSEQFLCRFLWAFL